MINLTAFFFTYLCGFYLFFFPVSAFALEDSGITKVRKYVESSAAGLGPKAVLAVDIRDAVSGNVLYARRSKKLLTPASVAKLFTSVAALDILGGSYRFPLEVFVDKHPGSSGEVGNMYVRGYGDPSFVDEQLWFVIKTLKQLGVKKINNIIFDDTLFIDPPGAGGHKAYNAGLSALSLNHNSYAVTISPAASGQKAHVHISPGAPVKLSSSVKTVAGGRGNIVINQTPASSSFVAEFPNSGPYQDLSNYNFNVSVSGSVSAGSKDKTFYRSVPDPTAYFAASFSHAASDAGMQISGKSLKGNTKTSSKLLKSFESKELALILRGLNQYSNNIIAGQILYLIGQNDSGYFSSELGLKRLKRLIVSLGEGEGELFDGSGLHKQSRISVAQLSKLLVKAYNDFSIGPELISSLSRYKRSGTLKLRKFGSDDVKSYERAGKVWGKTGTLTGVSSLAGYLESDSGRRLVYSIIVNGPVQKSRSSKIETKIVDLLMSVN